MKNKIEIDFQTCENFVGDLSINMVEKQRSQKNNVCRRSVTPKIVVCPPTEEMTDPINTPRENPLKARQLDSDSVDSSSSSDSGENRLADDRSSGSISESGSNGSERRRHRSIVALRRVFQSLNLISRSHSCSTERPRQPKKQTQPKRILRSPVTYTYVRGLSGLPTQRVPRQHVVCCNSPGLYR